MSEVAGSNGIAIATDPTSIMSTRIDQGEILICAITFLVPGDRPFVCISKLPQIRQSANRRFTEISNTFKDMSIVVYH